LPRASKIYPAFAEDHVHARGVVFHKIIDKEIFYEYNGAGRKRKGVGGLLLNV